EVVDAKKTSTRSSQSPQRFYGSANSASSACAALIVVVSRPCLVRARLRELLNHRVAIEFFPAQIHGVDLPHVLDVLERVGVQHDEARGLAGRECPEIFQAQKFGRP